jgi:hypothetical protein
VSYLQLPLRLPAEYQAASLQSVRSTEGQHTPAQHQSRLSGSDNKNRLMVLDALKEHAVCLLFQNGYKEIR